MPGSKTRRSLKFCQASMRVRYDGDATVSATEARTRDIRGYPRWLQTRCRFARTLGGRWPPSLSFFTSMRSPRSLASQ